MEERRTFIKQAVWMMGGVWLAPRITGRSAHGLRVLDQERCFVNNAYQTTGCRPVPPDPGFLLHPHLPGIPAVNPVPFEWEKENFSSGNGYHITDNVYLEDGKPWVLQLAISTPGKSDTASGSPLYKIWYRVSTDNGVHFTPLKQLIVKGHDRMKPVEGVQIGRNGFNVDFGRPVVKASNGEIMVPVGLHPWDAVQNKRYLPNPKAFLFQDAGVLAGKWAADGSDLQWEFGEWLRIDHHLSTRGLSEPSIMELRTPGHFAMVARGSNLGAPDLPCYAWVSFSKDYCRTWSPCRPLGYSDGGSFFVTTAQSALFKSRATGKTYWVGNLQKENPKASAPRYPLVIGEMDPDAFGLVRDTVIRIDTRLEDKEDESVQLSNFRIMEHKTKNEIIISLRRRDKTGAAAADSWYRIRLA